MGKFFGTDGIRGTANVYPITAEVALSLGKSTAAVLKQNPKCRKKIIIGKDTRKSGDMLESALAAGLCSMGFDALLAGIMPTPAVAELVQSFKADAGFVISASHNPPEDNGIKMFSSKGFKLADDEENKIEEVIFSDKIKNTGVRGDEVGKIFSMEKEMQGRYIHFAQNTIQHADFDELKIVVDCANGAASSVAPAIFSELCPNIKILNASPDGLNINHNCGALHPLGMQTAVKELGAHAGIAFDGDADRLIMCDEKGNEINGDHVMAICGIDLIKQNKLNQNTLVATQYSNLGLDEALKTSGGKVVRVLNGDRYVVEKMKKNDFNFGGEATGHLIFMDKTTTGDGIISALQVLFVMKKQNALLSELAKCISFYPQVIKNVEVREKRNIDDMPAVRQLIDNINKKLGEQGRTLVRYSGTENKARVMIEGKDKQEIEIYAKEIAEAIKKEVG